jgi:4-hydroxybutyrate dehydrogenase
VNTFKIEPVINLFQTVKEYIEYMPFTETDLLFISEHTFHNFLDDYSIPAHIVFLRKYGQGEPTDSMVNAIYEDIKGLHFKRVIAIGGGTILDVAKLFALKEIQPLTALFNRDFESKKDKELIMIPTTCGTGSEVTNISILELTSINTKKGLAYDQLYADTAVIIPQLMKDLPYKNFATSSLDAFIHGLESYLSPKSSPLSEMYSLKAMELILKGYLYILASGPESRYDYAQNFMLAGTIAGIAFGNAGCAAVHALSYPLGAQFHIPHGEANYCLLQGVLKEYQTISPHGKLLALSNFLSEILHCCASDAFDELDLLLNSILTRKKLSAYGITKDHLSAFSKSVLLNQQRLLANNYIPLSSESIMTIYQSVL